MDSKKANKISEIVRLQQILKKWKKLANSPKTTINKTNTTSTGTCSSSSGATTGNNGSSSTKSINKLLKKTLSFSESSSVLRASSNDAVPKGFLAVCVGKDLKRFVIPTEYLVHQAFGILLREAEEEFGFQQEGVLRLPCEVPLFQKILKMVEDKREVFLLHDFGFNNLDNDELQSSSNMGCFSPDCDCELTSMTSHHSQLCR
ncbi:hypothetical protein RHGRI_025280 [Rhododendron griersonianum]|uniref:SAUR family protein n=1 Tax=Rhododendron griersonianum TaxID=479676 RepID=A0AAV6JBM5_9ERIC|nr:hypothetical protein RHGRI_025280 [Rhododendron griersonianum]